jgi:hypothetical protein
MPTLVTGRASSAGGTPAGRFVTHDETGQGLVLRRGAVRKGRVLGQGQQVKSLVDRRYGAVQSLIELLPREVQHPVPHVPIHLGPGHGHVAADHPCGPLERALQEVGRFEEDVGDTHLGGLLRLEDLLGERVLQDHLGGAGNADQVGQQLAAAPAGDEPDRDLGQRAVMAVQGDLEAAAQRRTVDEREGRDGAVLEPGEHLVPEPTERERLGVLGDQRHAGDVRADAEDVRLAGQRDEGRVRLGGPGDRLVEAGQPGRAEAVRLFVVEAVVQGDQGGGPVQPGNGHQTQERLGHDLVRVAECCRHWSAPSR